MGELRPSFNPLNPRTWPSLYMLIFLLPVTSLLCQFLLKLPFDTTMSVLMTLLAIISIKAYVAISDRYETFKVFNKGNVPSIGNTSLLSGNILDCAITPKNFEIIQDYHKNLGETFGIFFGPDPWVYTKDLDLLHRVFVENGNKNIDKLDFRIPYTKEMNLSLAAVQGNEWRTIRRILNPSFALKQLKSDNAYHDIEKNCQKMIDCIQKHRLEMEGDQNQKSHRIVEINYLCGRFTLEVIFQVAFGHENATKLEPYERDPLVDMLRAGAKFIINPVSILSVCLDNSKKFLAPLVKFTPAGSIISRIHQVLDESLKKRRMLGDKINSGNRKMIDSIMESVKLNKIDDDKLKANLFIIFIGGQETTSNTLTILLWLLSRHQHVQNKLRSSVLIEGPDSEYLSWCIKETLRLYPAVPLASGRILHEDLEHKGMKFFKGTTILASIHAIHYSEKLWGKDVQEFRPDRFGEPLAKQHPLQYFAFSHGPRYCIGMNLAHAEIKNLISRIILRYKLETCPTTPEKLNITTQNLVHMIVHDDVNIKFLELDSI